MFRASGYVGWFLSGLERRACACALAAGRGVEVDTLAMNVALSTGVVADHIEDGRWDQLQTAKSAKPCFLPQEVEALLAEARNWGPKRMPFAPCLFRSVHEFSAARQRALPSPAASSFLYGRLQAWTSCRRDLSDFVLQCEA